MVSLAELVGLPSRLAARVEARVLEFWERHGRPALYVGFSGGKDSSAVLAAAVRAVGVDATVAWFWHIPGQTVKDNIQAAREVARALGLSWRTIRVGEPSGLWGLRPEPGTVYHVIRGGPPYWELLAARGPPFLRHRWCCKYYKEDLLAETRPQRPGHRYVLTGVRPSDSRARASLWSSPEREFKSKHGVVDHALAPLWGLTTQDVWLLLEHYGLKEIVEQQYRVWGRSPNCVLCPLSSKKQLEKAARQLPTPFLQRYYDALRRWDTSLAKRMRSVIEAELARRGDR